MKVAKLHYGLWIAVLILIVSAGNPVKVWAQETQTTLTVFAAASLTDAFEEMGAAFEALHPDVKVVFNFSGSSALATQLVEGAPADIFASANQKQMSVVADAGLISGEPQVFARNRLVLALPFDNPAGIATLADLTKPGIRLVLAAPGVPVRDYTETMLTAMTDSAEYGSGYHDAVLANLVSEEDNVRQVVVKIALGEADAGVVYLSDITPDVSAQIQTISIPDKFNTLAAYPIAKIQSSSQGEQAQAFIDYVLAEPGQATLTRWGFIPVIEAAPPTTQTTTSTGQSVLIMLLFLIFQLIAGR